MVDIVQAFQLGSSTVVTIPKSFKVIPGRKLKIFKRGQEIVLKEEAATREQARKIVKKLSGGLNLNKHITVKDLNKAFDESYDKMLP